MKRLSLGVAMGGLTAVTVLFAACGTNEPANGAGAGGGPGLIDGGGSGGRSSAGAGGRPSGSGGGGSGPEGPVGKECQADGDCAEGLFCMTEQSDALGGGPAGGLCTADCADDAGMCADLDPNAICLRITGLGSFCHEACVIGGTADKCHTRPDMACTQGSRVAYCSPQCRGDFDCGTRSCDLGTGLCTDTLSGTLPMGAPCDSEATTNQCRAGFCLSLVDDAAQVVLSFCSAGCTFGETGCGFDPTLPGPVPGLCMYSADTPSVGDSGACSLLCDCNDDCGHPDMICSAFEDPEFEASVGRLGACSSADDGMGGREPGLICRAPRPDAGPQPDAGTGGAGAVPDAAPGD